MSQHWLENSFKTCCGKARHFALTVVPVANSTYKVSCHECVKSAKFKADKKAINRELANLRQHTTNNP